MSIPGESYEQWRERTAPKQQVQPVDTRRWDLAAIVLLGLFFLWMGGTPGWIGLGIVAVLGAEQVLQSRLVRASAPTASPEPRLLQARGLTLLVTVALSVWLLTLAVETAPLPVLLVLLDIKDERSFLRRAPALSDRLSRSRRR